MSMCVSLSAELDKLAVAPEIKQGLLEEFVFRVNLAFLKQESLSVTDFIAEVKQELNVEPVSA